MGIWRFFHAGGYPHLNPAAALAALAAGAVLVILVSTAILLFDLRQRELSHAQGEIVSLSQILAEQTTRALDGVDLVLRSTQDRLGDEIGQRLTLDSPMVHLLLRSRVAGLPQVASIFVADAQGMVINSSRAQHVEPHSIAQRDYFAAWARGGVRELYVGHPLVGNMDGKWTVHVSRRLSGPKGEFRGVVVASINLGYFEELYASIHRDFVSPIALLLADGTLAVSQPVAAVPVGQRLIDLEQFRLGVGGSARTAVDRVGDHFYAFRPVSKFPLVIAVGIEEEEALAPWLSIAMPIAVGAIFVSLLIAVGGWLLGRDAVRQEHLSEALQESNRQLRELSVAQQEVREDERTRIARELHDELGQKLTGLRLELSWLLGRVRATQPELVGKIEGMKEQVSNTIEEVRRISSELRPLMLDDLGFAAAAEWMVEDFSRRSGIGIELDLVDADRVSGGAVATGLFRVLQESLTNVVRHAEAGCVEVSVRCVDDELVLSVRDDGKGMQPHAGRGIGLIGMRERVAALGGRLAIRGEPGAGVEIEVAIPLETAEDAA